MIRISFLLLASSLMGSTVQEMPLEGLAAEPAIAVIDRSEALSNAIERYMDFSNRMGKGDAFSQVEEEMFLAPDCKKIFNGHLFTETRKEFVAEFQSIYQNFGGWKTNLVDIVKDPSENKVVLRLIIESENYGFGTAITMISYDSSYRITELNEVFSQIQDAYDFKK
jgi:hypothetical protein